MAIQEGIAKNLRTMEWLKTELVTQTAHLFHALYKGSEELLLEALSGLLITVYVIGKRSGIPYDRLSRKASQHIGSLVRNGHEMEKWYGDLSALSRHFNGYSKDGE